MDPNRAMIVEAMAKAAWDKLATVPWDIFFGQYPEKKPPYLAQQLAALEAYEQIMTPRVVGVIAGVLNDLGG